ncbi:hypothetical protein TWF594_010444 [Orbilia oligospora]|nr:hypothetical protein TWF706_001089 [Orbilia oligospora]KAF3090227.1 hypothetical protein TWF103_011952 [Orbilia oligospora]KAF3130205.1 hypothetical protein TWF594_010444 [Orbilia oligospora]
MADDDGGDDDGGMDEDEDEDEGLTERTNSVPEPAPKPELTPRTNSQNHVGNPRTDVGNEEKNERHSAQSINELINQSIKDNNEIVGFLRVRKTEEIKGGLGVSLICLQHFPSSWLAGHPGFSQKVMYRSIPPGQASVRCLSKDIPINRSIDQC